MAVGDDADVQTGIGHDSHRPFDGTVDPVVAVAEDAPADSGQQHLVRTTGAGLFDCSQQGRLVGRLQNQSRERLPGGLGH